MAKDEVTVVKKVKNGVLYSDGTIRIERVRFSYPHLGTPYLGDDDDSDEDGKPKKPSYSVLSLLKKDTHAEVKDLIVARMKELIEENSKNGSAPKITADKKFIRDGDGELVSDENAAGHWTVSARESRAVTVFNRKGEIMSDKAAIDEMFYGGCWGHVIIRPWFQDSKKWGKRINSGLVAAFFWRDDESFGESRISAMDAKNRFADLSDSDGDDDGFGSASSDEDDDGL